MTDESRRWVITTAPTEKPITVAEAKTHLRVDIADDDNMIDGLIGVATDYLESRTSSAFITQTWDLWLDDWPDMRVFYLPKPPVQSVVHIKYFDENNTESVFAASNYLVDTYDWPGRIVLKTGSNYPNVVLRQANGINVQFVCGYGLAAAVPDPLKMAIKLLVGDLYENRENTLIAQGVTVAQLPFAVNSLIEPFRNHARRF